MSICGAGGTGPAVEEAGDRFQAYKQGACVLRPGWEEDSTTLLGSGLGEGSLLTA